MSMRAASKLDSRQFRAAADPTTPESIRANWPRTAKNLLFLADWMADERPENLVPVAADAAEAIRLAVLLADREYQRMSEEGWPP